MTATITSATDDILTLFNTAWETTGAASEISTGVFIPVYWPNTDKDAPTENELEWVRATFTNSGTGQHSGIGSGTGRYTKSGIVFFSIFTEKGEGMDRFNALAQIIVDAFDGNTSPNGVVFRETAVNQIGSKDANSGWYQTNVVVSFEFDEFK